MDNVCEQQVDEEYASENDCHDSLNAVKDECLKGPFYFPNCDCDFGKVVGDAISHENTNICPCESTDFSDCKDDSEARKD